MSARVSSSFRDPAGYVMTHDDVVHRCVQPAGAASYRQLTASGLHEALVAEGLLVAHEDPVTLGPSDRVLFRFAPR